jgi:hypothetical protein
VATDEAVVLRGDAEAGVTTVDDKATANTAAIPDRMNPPTANRRTASPTVMTWSITRDRHQGSENEGKRRGDDNAALEVDCVYQGGIK